jgi:hypothetical protein
MARSGKYHHTHAGAFILRIINQGAKYQRCRTRRFDARSMAITTEKYTRQQARLYDRRTDYSFRRIALSWISLGESGTGIYNMRAHFPI